MKADICHIEDNCILLYPENNIEQIALHDFARSVRGLNESTVVENGNGRPVFKVKFKNADLIEKKAEPIDFDWSIPAKMQKSELSGAEIKEKMPSKKLELTFEDARKSAMHLVKCDDRNIYKPLIQKTLAKHGLKSFSELENVSKERLIEVMNVILEGDNGK